MKSFQNNHMFAWYAKITFWNIQYIWINSSFLKLGYISFLKNWIIYRHILMVFARHKENIAQQVYSLNMYSLKSVLLYN